MFSSFDPFINSSFKSSPSLFWASSIVIVIFIHSFFWMSPNNMFWLIISPMNIMNSQSLRTNSLHFKGFTSIIVSLFMLIISINFMGLLPYSFSLSSHLIFTLVFGLPLWLSLIMSSLSYNPSSFMAGLLPSGAPDWLNPFLVMVETLSISVRPITLSFRLAANMSAGHIVLGLIGIYASSSIFIGLVPFLSLFFIQIIYIIFEMGICLIQAYIFCLLLTLYSDDHTTI
uniref:ATP synthase subunit a n=1 Tax=Glycinde armigera TaxID=397552 RepID=A0A0U2N2K1_9ANNE|nr:ATP synthase F0 subunit 6 [Glycinde armigera]